MDPKNIAVISSRLKCVDAISVEAERWIDQYEKLGFKIHLIAGKLGEPVEKPSRIIPEMDYKHPEVRGIKRIMFTSLLDKKGKKAAEILLNNLVSRIKKPLKKYIEENNIAVLHCEDVLGTLKNLPLSIAMSQITKELDIPVISRYHYLHWQNPYFSKHDNFPKLSSNLPPQHKNIIHITSTKGSSEVLKEKKNILSKTIPNTIDLSKLHTIDEYNKDFRTAFGIKEDELIFLQPTRIKRNKLIEQSIKLVAEINDITKKDNVLFITGSPVYSRGNYFEEIVKKINKQGVKVIFGNDRIFLGRHQNNEQKFYSIHDAYVHSDIVLYPNCGDAFGNPIIEAGAYKKPIVVNTYPNLKEFVDKGFKFIVMDQKVSAEVISDLYELITQKEKQLAMTSNNYALLEKYYSAEVLETELMPILKNFDPGETIISRFVHLLQWNKETKKDLKNKKGGYKEPEKENGTAN